MVQSHRKNEFTEKTLLCLDQKARTQVFPRSSGKGSRRLFYVRTAVRDRVSGKAGSAYQFVEIPDLKKKRLSLSSLFIINREEDLPWISSETKEAARNLLYPDVRRDPRKSPAIRSYLPGESFEYAAVIYNAKNSDGKPDLEVQFILYGNGKELQRSPYEAISLPDAGTLDNIPITRRVSLGDSLQPGDYFLALQVKDKRADEKHNLAFQGLDFKVLEQTGLSEEERSQTVERKEITLPDSVLDRYVGTYKMGPELHLMVTRIDHRLFSQVTGQVKLPLYPVSETKFFLKAVEDAENEFVKNEKGEVTHIIVRRGEGEATVPRISNKVVERKEIELSPESLAQYLGTYRLEKGLEMRIMLEGGRLYSQIRVRRCSGCVPNRKRCSFRNLWHMPRMNSSRITKGR